MPIPGLTDVNRLPRLGKIRLGEKVEGQRGQYPKATDYFVMKDAPGLENLDLGPRPTTLKIRFLADAIDDVFITSRSAYGKGTGLFCRCSDGVTAIRTWLGAATEDKRNVKKGQPLDRHGAHFIEEQGLDVEVGEMFEMPCEGDDCPYFKARRCSILGRLQFEVLGQAAFGIYEIATTSKNSILNVSSVLNYCKARYGQIANIPMVLRLVPKQVQAEGKPKTVHVLQLIPPNADTMQAAVDAGRLKPPKDVLPAATEKDIPEDLYPDEGEALDADFGDEPPHPAEEAMGTNPEMEAKKDQAPADDDWGAF